MKKLTIKDYLMRFVNEYNYSICEGAKPYFQSVSLKDSISQTLLNRLSFVCSPFINKELLNALSSINPFYAFGPQLVPKEDLDKAKEQVVEKLNYFSLIPNSLISTTINNFTSFFNSFISDFMSSKSGIEQTLFEGKEITEVEEISATSYMGCGHGRLALIVTTNAGKFVYKKHDCRAEVWMNNFISSFFVGRIYAPKCLADSNSCGFCEYIVQQNPTSEELPVYYENLGIVASLARALGLSDLHKDNIIPHKTVPVLIDLEMLFQPFNVNSVDEMPYGKTSDEGYFYYLNRSVIGHFPFKTNKSPLTQLNGVTFSESLKTSFFKGFCYGYTKILNNKQLVLQEVEKTSDFKIRRVLRESSYYIAWTRKIYSNSPGNYLNTILNKNFPNSLIVCKYEYSFLEQGNCPYFYTLSSSTDLFGEDGQLLVKQFFYKSPLEMAKERLAIMSDENLNFEKSMIKAVFVPYNRDEMEKDDNSFIDYWEKTLIKAENGECFWLNPEDNPQSRILPPDEKKGIIAVLKRCAEIAKNTNDQNLKNRAIKVKENFC